MLKEESISAVIFDLDGTIYNKDKLKMKLIKSFIFQLKMLKSFLKTRKQLKGISLENKTVFEKHQIEVFSSISKKPEDKCKKFIDRFLLRFVKILENHFTAYPEVKRTITLLNNNNIPVCCLSDYPVVKERLTAIDIDVSKFNLIKSSEDYGTLKPASKAFLGIANELNIEPKNILIIGDRDDTDGEGARNSGMQFLKYPEEFNQIKQLFNAS